MTEKQSYQETPIIDSKPEVEVKPSQKQISYKTKLEFIDSQRGKRSIVSVVTPQITQSGMLQFLQEDRMISYPLNVIFSFEVEQLQEIKSAEIVVKEKQ